MGRVMDDPVRKGPHPGRPATVALPWESIDAVLAGDRKARRGLDTPESHLLVAVLEDALHVIALGRDHGGREKYDRGYTWRKLALETVEWVQGADRNYLFTFDEVCDYLGLDASAVRKRALGGETETGYRIAVHSQPMALKVGLPLPSGRPGTKGTRLGRGVA
jgi:hypothetical protein